ncbi:MAG: DUF4013 domain-containing protein [Methanoregulaceae archaeon]|jgi:hypothetical protein|nr:DUF4013 domain-containing protein [Methanoregulaceae archaeon]
MDYGKMLQDSYHYAHDAVWGKWERWLLLLMSIVIFPLITGYVAKIYRGDQPAPRFEEGGLFIMGLKLIFAMFIYAIPVIAVFALTLIYAVVNFMPYIISDNPAFIINNPEKFVGVLLGIAGGLIITLVLAVVISLISTIALIRLAKEGKFSEAFNFGAVMQTIHSIGWGRYIVAMIIYWVISVVLFVLIGFLNLIPVMGMAIYWIIYLIIIVPYIVFSARYLTLVYDSAPPAIPKTPVETSG